MLLPEGVSGIGLSDLQRLVDESAQEDGRLDFKSIDVRKERIERTMCAFANTSGGIS